MRRTLTTMAALAAAFLSNLAAASFHTFRINEIYSNADGSLQFIELREGAGAFGQNFFAGQTISTSGGGSQHAFAFTSNLPSSGTAGTFVLIATQSFAALGLVAPDFIVPDNFVPIGGGAVNFANVDIVNFSALPTDGTTSIDRNGVPQANSPRNFVGQTGTVPGLESGVTEFFNTGLNHYFLTANAIEAQSIDAGGSGPGWTRTGNVFKSGGSNAVCRFYGVQTAGGPNGHFYTADPAECDQVKVDPGWHFESLDFAITPPLAGGVCPQGLVNVYRAYNKRFAEHDSNHRITTNFNAYQQQIAAGWQGEGVVMCAEP
jgi:hypothetical protein